MKTVTITVETEEQAYLIASILEDPNLLDFAFDLLIEEDDDDE